MLIPRVLVVGGGLAGAEAAWQAAERGVHVVLAEMRPERRTPAHRTGRLAELVCSNSFKSLTETTGSGLLKRELADLGGHLLGLARQTAVPAGTALAVDRDAFAAAVETSLAAHPRIRIERREVAELCHECPTLVATGPLTSDRLAATLRGHLGTEALYYFDAISPIVDAESIDRSRVFPGSRYGHGEDYLNCPLDPAQYRRLRAELVRGEKAEVKDFDHQRLFEGCLPIEELAARGEQTMAFGPLKPVGLRDPHSGRMPHAVVQLRAENRARTMFGLVGFQTRLKYGDQQRILRLIPGLENAEFLRLGSMHRNSFVDAPQVLDPDLTLRRSPRILLAGQLTGAEGYVEAQATGLLAGINLARLARGDAPLRLPASTAIGALCTHLATAPRRPFQPTGFHFGLLPPLSPAERPRGGRRVRKEAMARRARLALDHARAAHADLRVAAAEPV